MDEALKHESVRRWITAFTEAMQSEDVPDETRRRVLNRVLFGNPDGDVFAKASLDVEVAVANMDPETLLGFRKGEWITSAEEAGWAPVPETIVVHLTGATFTPHKPVSEESDRG